MNISCSSLIDCSNLINISCLGRNVNKRKKKLVIKFHQPLFNVIESLPQLVHVSLYLDVPGQSGPTASLL